MNKRLKLVLIIVFSLIFVVGCPMAIFYAQGYRINFEEWKIVKTGGIYTKTVPQSCTIYLDGKERKRSDFFFGNAYITELLPREYNVKISKDGYYDWEKTLEVKEELVTEIKSVYLFPKNLNLSFFLDDVEDYFFSPSQDLMIIKKSNEEDWWLDLYNLEEREQRFLIANKNLSKEDIEFQDVEWSQDLNFFLVKTWNKEKADYFIVDISRLERPEPYSLSYLEGAYQISFNPLNAREIFFLQSSGNKTSLFKDNYINKDMPVMIINDLVTYKIIGDDIFWINGDGFLYRSNTDGERLESLNNIPFQTKQETEYKIERLDETTLFSESNELYWLDPDSRSFEELGENIKDYKISPDQKKLCLYNDHEIWILYLKETEDQPRRKAGEKIFLTRFSKKIGDIYWLTDHHLVFDLDNEIKISEIDIRDRINMVQLSELENTKIFWNLKYKRLFTLSDNKIYFIENIY